MKPIISDRIVLKPLSIECLEDFLGAIRESENSVGRWLPWWTNDYSVSDARDWFEFCATEIDAKKSYDVGILQIEDNRFIGGASINHIDNVNRFGSIGYWVRETFQGQGIAPVAVSLITDFGFNKLDLARLELVILEENVASRKVAEK